MTRYFMRDTPLRYLEQEMMTPPHFKPRGHGLYRRDFRYRPRDVECQFCVSFARSSRCPLNCCPYLAERMEAGVLGLSELMQDCFSTWKYPRLQGRLRKLFCQRPASLFLNDAHRNRWQHWHERYHRMTDRNQAALYLLTAYEDIWRRMIWHFDEGGFDFNTIRLSGIHPEQYSVYQAAKAISIGSHNITLNDLASPELVTDEALQLIIYALLLARYGDVILNLERKTGDHS